MPGEVLNIINLDASPVSTELIEIFHNLNQVNGFRLLRGVANSGLITRSSTAYLSPVVQLAINRKYSNVLQTAAIKPDKLDLLNSDEKFKNLILSKTIEAKEKRCTLNKMLNDQFQANELTIKMVNSMIDKDLLKLLLMSDFRKIISSLRDVINDDAISNTRTLHSVKDQSSNTSNWKDHSAIAGDLSNQQSLVDEQLNKQLEDILRSFSKPIVNTKKKDQQQTTAVATVMNDLHDLDYKLADSTLNSNLVSSWLKLSKFRLTSLVVLTTLTGHYMGMTAFDPSLMFFTLLGTGLCSSSAAALNQFLEIPYDSQMSRTKSRPLVTHNVTPLHAFAFAVLTGLGGVTLLAHNVNTLTASLGALNLLLYSFIYTPMKRFNIANTWIGSIVGAIPPIMGYTAATGSIDLAAISLGLILYSWQFPHFNALSWNIKHDYARAGYRMMVVTNPELCVRTAFRHSWLIALYCELMCTELIGSNSWAFAFDSLPINLYLIYLAWKFKQNPNAKTSRTLFKFSLVHLPVLLTLLLLSKKSKNSSTVDDMPQSSTETMSSL